MTTVTLRGGSYFAADRRGFIPADLVFSSRSGRIERIHNSTDKTESSGVVDISGMRICPGLIDLHTHLSHEPFSHFGVDFSYHEDEFIASTRIIRNLTEALLHGVCHIRDLGSSDALLTIRDLIDKSAIRLPGITTAGKPLCLPGGHGHEFGIVLSPDEDLRKVMVRHQEAGHGWLKIMNGPERVSRDRLVALTEAAHEHGLRVAVHAFCDEAVWDCIDAQVDSVEHALIASHEMAEAAQLADVAFVPTAFAARTSVGEAYIHHQNSYDVGLLRQWLAYLETRVAKHLDAGLPVYPGTDAGCAPCKSGDIVDELIEFQRWGCSPTDVLKWATYGAASILGLEDKIGRIAEGFEANLIVVDKAVVNDLSALKRPALVVYRGIPIIDRLELNIA